MDIEKIRNTKAPNSESRNSPLMQLLEKDLTIGKVWNDKAKYGYYTTLYTLLKAGLDVYTSLTIVAEETSAKKVKEQIVLVGEHVVKGSSLSGALHTLGSFSTYETETIRLGEESGELTLVLNQLVKYYRNRMALRKLLTRVLAYPVFVVGVSLAVMWFMLSFVVPIFADVFARFDAEIPALTQWVISASLWLGEWSWLLGITAILLVTIWMVVRKTPTYHRISGQLWLKVPWFGQLIKDIYLARFTQSMALLLRTGTPLVKAIHFTQQVITFYPIHTALESTGERIAKGESLHACFKSFPVFPSRMVSLIKVAEEVNELDGMMTTLSEQLEEEVAHKSAVMGAILEPVMIVVIAVFVAVVLISMYLPLFELSNVIGK
ncbi:MAG: type II secretion system F family protein [Flavobacteriales bacterium]|nr:type II secretion system F family protein [Flavobacteriales bacterium]